MGPQQEETDHGRRTTHGYLSEAAETALHQVSTATLTSQLLKRGFRNTFLTGVEPLRPDLRMVGYAFTLRFVPDARGPRHRSRSQ